MTDAPSNARPIHSQSLLLGAVTLGILILAVYLTQSILESENGGISAAVRTIGACLAIWALVRPKAGLYIVTFEAFSVDFIKKVAVYYGTASMGTIIEVLIVTMLAVVATILGVLLQSVALRRYKLAPLNWAIFIGVLVLAAAMFLTNKGTLGFEKSGENAFNAAVFIALALPMSVFMNNREELDKILRCQFWLVVVWCLWGIKQYYYGFTQLEWFYAETGLSQVASEHMLKFANPRPFGFGSGSPNYGVISPYLAYGLWHLWHHRRKRIWYGLGTLVVFWGLVTSLQRTALVFPLFVPLFYWCFRNKNRTITIYAAATFTFLLGVVFADTILDRLGDINDLLAFKGDWAESVLTVGTYSDRLRSWETLKDLNSYSAFGLADPYETHDVFSRIIIYYGVVSLVVVMAATSTLTWFLHRTLLRIEDPQDRAFATFLLAATTPNVILGFIGGGNFTTSPTNLQLWTFFGAAVSLAVNSKLAVPLAKPSLAAIREALGQQPNPASPALPGPGRSVVHP